MKDRPILFTPEMAIAVYKGLKTVTRRVVKPQPIDVDLPWPNEESHNTFNDLLETPLKSLPTYSPYGLPGDRLWVKENWKILGWDDHVTKLYLGYSGGIKLWKEVPPPERETYYDRIVEYADTLSRREGVTFNSDTGDLEWASDDVIPWKSSLFMPKWISRTICEVLPEQTWLEQLHSISTEEAKLEGFEDRLDFQRLWDKLREEDGPYSWDSNPWVWRIGFKRVN